MFSQALNLGGKELMGFREWLSRHKSEVLYVAKKVCIAFSILLAIITLVFVLIKTLPGNPYQMYYYQLLMKGYPPEIAKSYAAHYAQQFYAMMASVGINVNESVLLQYVGFLTHVLTLNFGYSFYYKQSVSQIIASALPWTLLTVGTGLVLQFLIGVGIGMVLAYKRGSKVDSVATLAFMAWRAIPDYVIGLVILYVVLVYVYGGNAVEVMGVMSPSTKLLLETKGLTLSTLGPVVIDILRHAAWPILVYTIVGFAGWALAMRSTAINVLGEDYVTVAEARGLPDRKVATRYVGRNAILPLFTSLMISLGYAFGGSMFIEWLFNYRGIGYWMADAIWMRDYLVLSGCLLVETMAVVASVYLAEVLYGLIDPRVRGE